MSIRRTFLLGLYMMMLSQLLAAQTLAAASQSGWVLVQSSSYGGEQICFVSNKGIVIQNKVMTTVIELPGHKVAMYRPKHRTYCKLSYQDWLRYIQATTARSRLSDGDRRVRPGKVTMIAGVPAKQYTIESNIGGEKRITYDYWVSEECPVPGQYTKPLHDISGLPTGKGIPLRIQKIHRTRPATPLLETEKIVQTKIPDGVYRLPSGFKKVSSPVSLIVGGEEGAAPNDLVNSLKQ